MSKSASKFNADDFVDAAMVAAETALGADKCYMGANHAQVVLPLKPLALCALIQSNGWPLGRVTQSGGPFGTQKSSFIFELMKWYLQAGGFAGLVDTEYKTSPSLMRSIIPAEYMDAENPLSRRFMIMNATTVQDWQRVIQTQYGKLVEMSERAKCKPNFPIIWAVDSMMGSDSEGNLQHIRTEGEAPGKQFPEAPMLINQYMKSFPNMLVGWPITLHMSHHEKPKIGVGMGMGRQGGAAPDFYATLDIQFKKGGVCQFGKAMNYSATPSRPVEMRPVTLKVRKSSMGSDLVDDLTVLFCWQFDAEGVQTSWWDWDGSTAMLLKNNAKKLSDEGIMDVDSATKTASKSCVGGEHFWSDALGISKDSPLSASEFGAVVDQHEELRPKLNKFFHIQDHPTITEMYGGE